MGLCFPAQYIGHAPQSRPIVKEQYSRDFSESSDAVQSAAGVYVEREHPAGTEVQHAGRNRVFIEQFQARNRPSIHQRLGARLLALGAIATTAAKFGIRPGAPGGAVDACPI